MKKIIICSAFISVSAWAAGPMGSDIFIADLKQNDVLSVENITQRLGYDNQPLLTPEGVYYTAGFEKNQQWQTDIMFYDFVTKQTKNLTQSDVSEYSPTLMPSLSALSLIVVEEDGAQKLWSYSLAEPQKRMRIFESIAPVGYHAWGNNNELVMFILGEPHTLQFAQLGKETSKVIAHDIGRTLTYSASIERYAFSLYENGTQWLAQFNPSNGQVDKLLQLPLEVDYFAWREQQLVFAKQSKLYTWSAPQAAAKLWLDLSAYCQTKITRLNFSVDGNQFAFVCDELTVEQSQI